MISCNTEQTKLTQEPSMVMQVHSTGTQEAEAGLCTHLLGLCNKLKTSRDN